ncbi:extracellular solute-binding protein [Litoreibacter janthinus]|uniref:Microcin C transport system substrate-binding protein n=1 Tax=Litoreibacter janthinus TaxID=670154 RepID=A0A1I6G488_9RHOB|nr:extracellular solute-binding protein [Litoreibacter janthinus]SFR36961.1 microcin C transport system substrate-binding protein [Litoreibacter janthinus]
MKNHHPQALVLNRSAQTSRMKWLGAGLMLIAATVASVTAARSETIIRAHGFSDFGELKYPEGFPRLNYVNPEAPKGGEISVAAQGTFDSMNPFSRKGRGGALSSTPYERLMTNVDDDPYGAYCLLCESLEYPESQDWVIFNLRPEAKFSDGSPVTAQDVVFTVKTFLTDGLPSFAQAVSKFYKSYEALDDHRIKFTFNEGIPRKGLISQAGASIAFSKKWFDDNNANIKEPRLEAAIGSGPYVPVEVDPPRRIVYQRNPDYWGADLPVNKGRWNFDRIRIEYFADDTASMEAFKSGVYNFRRENSSLKWATAYDFPGIKEGNIVKAELPNGDLPPSYGMVFNLRRDKFDDPRVREALQLMYNFTWTNETLQFGLFAQRNSFWENTDLEAKGVAEGLELEYLKSVEDLLEDKSVLTEPVVVAHESSARQLDRKNLRKATQLLSDAGWESDASGVLSKDGKPLEIEFLSSNPAYDRLIQPYIENLKRLGIQAVYNRVDPAQYTNRERAFDWDMIYDGYINGFEEGNGISQRFGSEDAEYSLFNPSGYSSPAVDALIKKMLDAETLEEMQAAVRATDRILRAARIMIPAWYNDTFWVSYYDMFEHPDELPPLALGHLDFWWYNADKAAALKAKGAL